MKILACYDGSGSRYHRVKLPLSFFKDHEVYFTDKLEPELLQGIDILWIAWNNSMLPHYVSAFSNMFGFKVILDLDDSWDIPNNHIKDLRRSVLLSKEYAKLADCVIVSNPNLIEEVSKYNSNIHVIENGIPYDFGQFRVKVESEESFLSRRIKVGFFGSSSHYNDWLQIQGWVRTLVNNPLFKKNADFYICGYNSKDSVWNRIKSKFPEAIMVSGEKVDNYIPVFDLDICLVPLENNEFNRCKTELRVLESVCPGALCLLDPIYRELGENYQYHIVCEKDKDFLTATLGLLENKEELWLLKRDAQTLTRHNEEVVRGGYIEKCVRPRLDLLSFPQREFNHQIWSIMYEPGQVYDFELYLNEIKTVEQLSYLFEYNPMLKLIPQSSKDKEYVGIFSHKFGAKTGLVRNRVHNIIESEIKSGSQADVISFCMQIPEYLKWTEKAHPGFLWRFSKLCKELGLTLKEPKNVVYSNFFVAKREVYLEYIELLRRAIMCLTEESYKAFESANYKSGLSSEELFERTGLTHYTWHTFLLERLLSVWIDNKKLKTKNYMQ